MDKISIINQYFGWWIKFVNKVSKTTPWGSKAYTCTKVLYSSHQSSATIPYYTILHHTFHQSVFAIYMTVMFCRCLVCSSSYVPHSTSCRIAQYFIANTRAGKYPSPREIKGVCEGGSERNENRFLPSPYTHSSRTKQKQIIWLKHRKTHHQFCKIYFLQFIFRCWCFL